MFSTEAPSEFWIVNRGKGVDEGMDGPTSGFFKIGGLICLKSSHFSFFFYSEHLLLAVGN